MTIGNSRYAIRLRSAGLRRSRDTDPLHSSAYATSGKRLARSRGCLRGLLGLAETGRDYHRRETSGQEAPACPTSTHAVLIGTLRRPLNHCLSESPDSETLAWASVLECPLSGYARLRATRERPGLLMGVRRRGFTHQVEPRTWIVVLCMAAWGFTTGHVLPGLFVVAVGVFYSAHPFAALGAWLGARERRRKT
jgi:hypothetical protein